MNPRAHYSIVHWLRVLLWPLPVLSVVRAGRWAVGTLYHR